MPKRFVPGTDSSTAMEVADIIKTYNNGGVSDSISLDRTSSPRSSRRKVDAGKTKSRKRNVHSAELSSIGGNDDDSDEDDDVDDDDDFKPKASITSPKPVILDYVFSDDEKQQSVTGVVDVDQKDEEVKQKKKHRRGRKGKKKASLPVSGTVSVEQKDKDNLVSITNAKVQTEAHVIDNDHEDGLGADDSQQAKKKRDQSAVDVEHEDEVDRPKKKRRCGRKGTKNSPLKVTSEIPEASVEIGETVEDASQGESSDHNKVIGTSDVGTASKKNDESSSSSSSSASKKNDKSSSSSSSTSSSDENESSSSSSSGDSSNSSEEKGNNDADTHGDKKEEKAVV